MDDDDDDDDTRSLPEGTIKSWKINRSRNTREINYFK